MSVTRLREGLPPLIVATGGDEVYEILVRDRTIYRVHKFTASGNFVVTAGGGPIEALLVAGGGGSGGSSYREAGGGGGGGLIHTTALTVTAQTYPIVVGLGGAGGSGVNDGFQGGNSTAFGLTAVGGGRGARDNVNETRNGGNGGSGGGGSNHPTSGAPGFGVQGQGNNSTSFRGAGAGNDQNGKGLIIDITGSPVEYSRNRRTKNTSNNQFAAPGWPNTGEGARGAAGGSRSGAQGGSGIVVVRYPVRFL